MSEPDSETVTNSHPKVASPNRAEMYLGTTRGGCTYHHGVIGRMRVFREATAEHRYHETVAGCDASRERLVQRTTSCSTSLRLNPPAGTRS